MVSTKGRYALRVMLDMAVQPVGRFIPLKEIAERQNISVKYLEAIVSLLNRAGFLDSQRGKTGGYRLNRPPAQYSIGDILCATEGTLAPVACLEENVTHCVRSDDCLTLPLWQKLDQVIQDYLGSVSLADLLNQSVS